ncbi:hypothetical protein SISSUDRAFT_778587 [Sistotremastrum suecicum HHB10207 ss-3]|uniref:Uncharacterized protein n=1 Tax=Sistotremastrum suecicum HHB10207 ss-3 TaxID=1314776 RepID=A0A166D6M1_9AGAM|nr:hypothetical protein SISSUDRAFT_778587 [Sistotremastrum suecicum HHB10207 ss-3]
MLKALMSCFTPITRVWGSKKQREASCQHPVGWLALPWISIDLLPRIHPLLLDTIRSRSLCIILTRFAIFVVEFLSSHHLITRED